MGSLDRGMLTGFICRLCSEMHKVVIHMYSEEGLKLAVSDKINKYLPVNVSSPNPLPKTICRTCLERLEGQHRLMQQIQRVQMRLKASRQRNGRTPACQRTPPALPNADDAASAAAIRRVPGIVMPRIVISRIVPSSIPPAEEDTDVDVDT